MTTSRDPEMQAVIAQAAEHGIEIVYAVPDDSNVSEWLRHLTSLLATTGLETGYGLGGENGYGCEFENDVFEMHPYSWRDCECGFDRAADEWSEAHSHAPDCYQTVLKVRGGFDHAMELAKEWGLPAYGCAVHCTCGKREAYKAWCEEHDHEPTCRIVLPNFRHKVSGSTVRWYKYIGRDNEIDLRGDWTEIMSECVESIRG